MSYWNYYWMLLLASYLLQQPRLLAGLLVLLLLRRVLPAPGPIFRALRRGRALRSQLQLNPKNATAARDLAELELDLLRPRVALRWLDLALARCPDEAELSYLAGLALHRLGQHEQALTRLVAAVDKDARVRFGLAYLVAGDTLYALCRWEEALDAYERYQRVNSSDLRGYLGMARTHHRLGARAAAAERVHEALRTYRLLPYHLRAANRRARRSAFWLKVWMLREPKAMAQLLGLGVLSVCGACLVGLVVSILWRVGGELEEPNLSLNPERCEEFAARAPRGIAHRACLARAARFKHSYLDPAELDVDVGRLEEYGIEASFMRGIPTSEEGAPHYVGYQIAIPGTAEARFLVYNEVLRHSFQNLDFVDGALKPPIRIVDDDKGVKLEGADGQRRIHLYDQGTCLEPHDAGTRDGACCAAEAGVRGSDG